MKFVLVSTHIDQTTGYSKVAFNLLKQLATLAPKVKTYHFGFQRHPGRAGMRKYPAGVISYDAAANEEPREDGFGFNKIKEYIDMVEPNVVMIYNDPLIISKFIESMKHDRATSTYKLWVYADQVYKGIAQPLMDTINQHADRVYLFTEKWRKTYEAYFPNQAITNTSVLEHAVDSTVFSSLPVPARYAIRRNMNLNPDTIAFFNCNRNSQRKRLDSTIMGFVELLRIDPITHYTMVIATGMNPQHGAYYDVQKIFLMELQRVGLPIESFHNRMILIDTSGQNILNDDAINQLYNATDIGINTSDGEGFGLCQLEHMYTGAPQVVTDVGDYKSFMPDDIGVYVPITERQYSAGSMPLGSYLESANPVDIAKAMKECADNLKERKEKVMNMNFKSWSRICDGFLEDVLTEA